VTFSGDKLLGGPQAGIIAGRADLVARCARHPLARALRPGGLVLAALQELALTYLRREVTARVPFWRMVATPVDELRARADRLVAALDDGALAPRGQPMDAVPGAGSAPGVTMPSYGVVVAGDHVERLRAHEVPVIARTRDESTFLDLRSVEPVDDDAILAALGGS
jgi:L-seryl-tRNA(Ser) seleniumtransferase